MVLWLMSMALGATAEEAASSGGADRASATVDCAAPAPDDLAACVAERRAAWQRRGIVGMLVHPAPPVADAGRWRVKRTAPGGAAEAAGIHAGDVIVGWRGAPIPISAGAMDRAFEAVRVDDPIAVEVERQGARRHVELRARPANADQRAYWLLTYVRLHFPEEIFRRYEAEVGQRLERADAGR